MEYHNCWSDPIRNLNAGYRLMRIAGLRCWGCVFFDKMLRLARLWWKQETKKYLQRSTW